ncbi:DUF1501 domain-containing protein [Stratiformator vulcanicus]|uniref:Sulfatase n=1 Tax=Stratiformator vulcanicus TaxID=2527980 RepID=A0A517R5T6_9PLAN|nr:DUF1501 domain-containing protein [Stratiformator vulcanicus]QDT39248.1 hypothetical protein Pan189_36520 [Stratiformator vulcanicus]
MTNRNSNSFRHAVPQPMSRRDMLARSGAGFGALALNSILANEVLASPSTPGPHHTPTAKNVIFLFIEGGPSHIDMFDPKPELNKLAGQKLPDSFEPVILAMGEDDAPLLASPRKWKQHGESGLWFSDWLPHLSTCADDMAVIRSCMGDGINHSTGICQMNTGSPLAGRPSLGSWVNYGLGSENQDMPGFVVMTDAKAGGKEVVNGPRNWGPGFMPAVYQGTKLSGGSEPIPNLRPAKGMSDARLESELEFLDTLNRRHAAERTGQSELEARIESYELAFRMQAAAPDAVDLTRETEETRKLYGFDNKETRRFGEMCLLSRRLVERGVRFVQLYHGTGNKWDTHSGHEKTASRLCREMDQPVAALLKDLKRNGLLDETLVVWGGEFGRTPQSEKGDGRDHNPYGFTMWMAGGGVKGGQAIGATDEIGLHAVEHKLHVHDLHASILYALGLDHMKLEYFYKGRPERPTINEGEPCMQLFA